MICCSAFINNQRSVMKILRYLVLTCVFTVTTITMANTKPPQIHITWLGGPSMLIEFNQFRLLTDPMFGEGKQAFLMGDPNEMFDLSKGPNIKHHSRLTPLPKISNKSFDLVLLSHAHEDHFDQEAQRQINANQLIITPNHDLNAIKEKGYFNARSLNWQHHIQFTAGKGTIKITALPAHHSSNPDIDQLLGAGNGYWIEFNQGIWKRSIYWTGDTMPVKKLMHQLENFEAPDIFIPHLGRVGTSGPLGQISMGAIDVDKMVKVLAPKRILPIHHSSYDLYLEPIDELIDISRKEAYTLDLLKEGITKMYY